MEYNLFFLEQMVTSTPVIITKGSNGMNGLDYSTGGNVPWDVLISSDSNDFGASQTWVLTLARS